MKNFIMGLILAVVSIGASAAPTISDDQLRRIAAIALEQQAEKPEPAKAPVKIASKPEASISEKSEATRKEVSEWADMLSGIVVGTAQKVGFAVNEFVRTPVGLVVTGVIVYKAIGKDMIKLFFAGAMWIVTCIVSAMFFRHRPRLVRTSVVYENTPALFGLWNRRVLKSYDIREDGDIGYIFLGAAAFVIGTLLSSMPIFA